jgi:hypothetical protein
MLPWVERPGCCTDHSSPPRPRMSGTMPTIVHTSSRYEHKIHFLWVTNFLYWLLYSVPCRHFFHLVAFLNRSPLPFTFSLPTLSNYFLLLYIFSFLSFHFKFILLCGTDQNVFHTAICKVLDI